MHWDAGFWVPGSDPWPDLKALSNCDTGVSPTGAPDMSLDFPVEWARFRVQQQVTTFGLHKHTSFMCNACIFHDGMHILGSVRPVADTSPMVHITARENECRVYWVPWTYWTRHEPNTMYDSVGSARYPRSLPVCHPRHRALSFRS